MAPTQTFEQKLDSAVNNYNSSSKAFVELLIDAVDIYWKNSSNAGKIELLVNKLAAHTKLQTKVITLAKTFAPVDYVVDETTKDRKFSDSEAWKTLNKKIKDESNAEKKKELTESKAKKVAAYKAALELFRVADVNSVFTNYLKPDKKYFTPYKKADKATSKATDTGADLIARLLLSFPEMTLEDAKTKITAAINGLTSAEIENAKKAVLDKTPLQSAPQAETESPNSQAA
ncbi:hypothetical protein OXE08_004516 [Salmonella enterica]|nr:hypothetical protein [Salmonella enterica]